MKGVILASLMTLLMGCTATSFFPELLSECHGNPPSEVISPPQIIDKSLFHPHTIILEQLPILPMEPPFDSSGTESNEFRPLYGPAAVLQREMEFDSNLARIVDDLGVPDAVEWDSTTAFVMYYHDPPRTFIFYKCHEITIPDIPQSVRIMLFNEPLPNRPWPVTLTSSSLELLDVPKLPPPPPTELEPVDFTSDVVYIIKRSQLASGSLEQSRARMALQRLAEGAPMKGIHWRVIVVESPYSEALVVPDGTLLISEGLVRGASEPELDAVVAHLMGHVRYSHYRLSTHPTSGQPRDPRLEESEANIVAISYLARVGLGPSALFAAMAKLSLSPQERIAPLQNSNLAYYSMQDHRDNGAPDLGRMLDAGLIPAR